MQVFDFVCSLGGNCSAAHNLLIRNIRVAAFPFDWIYYKSDDAICKIAEGFDNNFADFMKKENLKLLPDNKAHMDRLQQEDTYASIVYANQFSKTNNWDREYEKVYKKFRRRFDRLINYVNKSKKILFLVCLSYEADITYYKNFLEFLAKKYPDKIIDVRVLSFNCNKDTIIKHNTTQHNTTQHSLILYMYKREINDYDFLQTNFEWSFLDNVKLCPNKNINSFIKYRRLRTFIILEIFPRIRTMFYFKIRLFRIKIYFCIGKLKVE